MSETTDDGFLGGRLSLLQPRSGYRAGIDPVLLAAAVDARPHQSVLDLGCGVGTAMLCLGARVPDLDLTGIERQGALVALADQNLVRNRMEGAVVEGDIAALPDSLKAATFDHVICNPPFFDRQSGSVATDGGREAGRGEAISLDVWLDVATRRLKPKGWLTLIQRVARLPDVMGALDARLGDVILKPIAARDGRAAELIILSARKGARGPCRLLKPFVLHDGAAHDGDRDSYTTEARAILRDGAALALA